MEVQADMRLCTVTEGLTEDAVSARLYRGLFLSGFVSTCDCPHSVTAARGNSGIARPSPLTWGPPTPSNSSQHPRYCHRSPEPIASPEGGQLSKRILFQAFS